MDRSDRFSSTIRALWCWAQKIFIWHKGEDHQYGILGMSACHWVLVGGAIADQNGVLEKTS